MEIKPCPFCGGESKVYRRGSAILRWYAMCVTCSASSDEDYWSPEDAADAWNQRYEQKPSEADRWLKEATEQRARADLAEMQRDELSEALNQARRMLAYAGKLQ